MASPLILALDLDSNKAIELAAKLDPKDCKLKVGSKLFTASGPSIISYLNNLGFDIFLDLKFHDIPNTVYEAIKEACKLGVWMVNVHCSGGSEMLIASKKSIIDNGASRFPLLIGVTLLTSIDKKEASQIGVKSIENYTVSLAKLAKDNGLDGVVCSPKEVKKIKDLFGKNFITVTPGIRHLGLSGDQKRVSTAKEALKNGSDYLVVGRPITESDNPVKSLRSLLKEIKR